ncbi:MAG: 5-formyltetrahydrofolate cyclo-ligase [Campylobacterota bacterium]|nr:5-formyltetrahydrofolate cyclo-ligase [Campylobacterota bacterium]
MPLTKKIFRKTCLDNLKNYSKHNKVYKDSLINNRLLKELKYIKNKKILFYCPLPDEANILKVLKIMRKTNHILVPFMVGKSFKVVPYRLPLRRNKFNIFEAGNTYKKINKIDIAIVPAVGVDSNLQRIGFGKGMYDRFFAKLKIKPYTIFIQPEICFTKETVCDDYDVKCDVLLTPKVVVRK